jgi:DNA-binding NarL/FixJ family response regulator
MMVVADRSMLNRAGKKPPVGGFPMSQMPVSSPMRAPKRRVFIVDDHPIVRRGLVDLVEAETDLEPCGEAGDAAEALAAIPELQPDLVLLDLSLGTVFQGFDLIDSLREVAPSVRILVTSMHDEGVYAERALRSGASGYVGKHESPDVLLAAIRKVLGGAVAVSGALANRLLKAAVGGRREAEGTSRLSQREFEVFLLIGRGLGTREIAEQLHVSAKTVETHRARIKEKLGVASGTELLVNAIRFRLEKSGESA